MILIPLSTDAPIYHWPWMTLVLIAVNVVTFLLTGRGEQPDGWLLTFGQGLHPLEWLANNFLHFGIMHLIGNMIFLWSFGIVVEGKLGWWRYLLLYLLIGIAGGALVQAAMLGQHAAEPPGSGGASLCIYALLAICIVWAPKNEMDCFLLLGYRAMMVELSILTLGGIYVTLQVLEAWWDGFHISSAMLHLTGAVVGLGAGFALLRLRLVDCENWDLIAVWNNTYGDPSKLSTWHEHVTIKSEPIGTIEEVAATSKPKKRRTIFRPSIYQTGGSTRPPNDRRTKENHDEPPNVGNDRPRVESLATDRGLNELPAATRKVLLRIRELLKQGKPQAALAEYRKRLRVIDHWPLELLDLQALANGLYQLKLLDDALPLMHEFVDRFPGRDDVMRVKLATVYCDLQQRPRAAIRQLDAIDADDFSDVVQQQVARIRKKAEQLIADGVLELDGKSW